MQQILRNAGLFLATVAVCFLASGADVIYDIDWVTKEDRTTSKVPDVTPEPSGYESQIVYIQHWSSQKFVYPSGGMCPALSDQLELYRDTTTNGKIDFKFVQVIGQYGYLEHSCGLVIHPEGGDFDPEDQTRLELYNLKTVSSLFTVDEAGMSVKHRQGRIVHPLGGRADPEDGTRLVYHEDRHDGAKFQFVDPATLEPVSVLPTPNLNGTWKVIYAVIDPLVDHEYRLSFSIGKSVSKQASEGYEWNVEGAVAFSWFEASGEYQAFAQVTESVTWEAEIFREVTIKVPAGVTVVTWQYFFEAERFADGLKFRSSILADTNDLNTPPPPPNVLSY